MDKKKIGLIVWTVVKLIVCFVIPFGDVRYLLATKSFTVSDFFQYIFLCLFLYVVITYTVNTFIQTKSIKTAGIVFIASLLGMWILGVITDSHLFIGVLLEGIISVIGFGIDIYSVVKQIKE